MSQSEAATGSDRPGSGTSQAAKGKTLYAGGPIDYIEETDHKLAGWQHGIEGLLFRFNLHDTVRVFCPKCAVEPGDDNEAIFERNYRTLVESSLALFRIDGTFTMGTPIEISLRMQARPAGVAIWAEPHLTGGLFMRRFVDTGAILLTHRDEVETWLRLASR